ncbi:hypothetical protein OYC64_000986 [Pagothenia borchgrevinki]|uniref:Uncharacterized protein n=1 Tax=Pagothenia borchgrevinki TaxID=8213 RepID=A0ABD2HGC7_PAGBO
MSDLKEEEEDKSPVSSCLSLKSDRSKEHPLLFSDEPGPSDTKQRAEFPFPGYRSLRGPSYFSNEPGPSDTK